MAQADTIYSNLGAGDSFNAASSHSFTGVSTFISYKAMGQKFVAPQSYTLTLLELGFRHVGGSNLYQIGIAPDSFGQPGALLASWTTAMPTVGTLMGFTPTAPVMLQAGQTYWVMAFPGNASSFGGWSLNNQGLTGGMFFQGAPAGAWAPIGGTNSALRVSGTVAPEPGALALLALGALAGCGVSRRRHLR